MSVPEPPFSMPTARAKVNCSMHRKNMDDIHEKLDILTQWDTVPAFCHAFYGFIAERLDDIGRPGQKIARGYVEFLNAEVQYHRQLSVIAGEQEIPIGDVQSLAEKRQRSLQVVAENLAKTPASSTYVRGLKHLILAECHYHRRDSERVVDQLRTALSCGVDDSLIRFALGYNLYVRAIERYTIVDADGTCIAVIDHQAFQTECMKAVAAFEAGLSGTSFDPQIHAWMAHVLESAGMIDAARDLQEQAVPEENAWTTDGPTVEALSPDEEIDNGDLPPITEAEIQKAGELLSGTFTPAQVRGDEVSGD